MLVLILFRHAVNFSIFLASDHTLYVLVDRASNGTAFYSVTAQSAGSPPYIATQRALLPPFPSTESTSPFFIQMSSLIYFRAMTTNSCNAIYSWNPTAPDVPPVVVAQSPASEQRIHGPVLLTGAKFGYIRYDTSPSSLGTIWHCVYPGDPTDCVTYSAVSYDASEFLGLIGRGDRDLYLGVKGAVLQFNGDGGTAGILLPATEMYHSSF